jgi:Cu+-exporting ATPase
MVSHHDSDRQSQLRETTDRLAVTDPVYGMTVDRTASKPTYEHKGELFRFCSQGCHDKFAADSVLT